MIRQITAILFALGLMFLLLVISAVYTEQEPPMRVGQAILAQGVEQTGSANLVTSVVLAYRGYDTLGELSILFTAALGLGLLIGKAQRKQDTAPAGFVLQHSLSLLFPIMLLIGSYIILHGHLSPGGGFQGGVIMAVAFFLPLLARPSQELDHQALVWIEGLAGASFIGIGLWALYQGQDFLSPLGVEPQTMGQLLSAGSLPFLYIAVGFKVGAELTGLMQNLMDKIE